MPLLVASLTLLAFSVSSAGAPGLGAGVERARQGLGPGRAIGSEPRVGRARPVGPPLRAFCARPRALRLRRFEDGSARLECARRTLVRVAVPG